MSSSITESFSSTSPTVPVNMDAELTNEEILDRCSNWTLACDNALLNKLTKFSEKLVAEAQDISNDVNKLSDKLNYAGNELNLITNQFFMLSNTQFIENKVEEFEETCTGTTTPSSSSSAVPTPPKTKADREAELIMQMKESIQNGMRVKQEFAKLRDQPMSQQLILPHLIGSAKFFSSRYCGLASEAKSFEVSSSTPLPNLSTPVPYSEADIPKTNSTDSTPSTTDSFLKQPTGYIRELYRPPSTVQTVEKEGSDSSEDLFPRKGFSSSSSSLATASDMKPPSVTSTPETRPKTFVDELNNVFIRHNPPPFHASEESDDDDFTPTGGVQGMFDQAFQDSELGVNNNNKPLVKSDDVFPPESYNEFSPNITNPSTKLQKPPEKDGEDLFHTTQIPAKIQEPNQETVNSKQTIVSKPKLDLPKMPKLNAGTRISPTPVPLDEERKLNPSVGSNIKSITKEVQKPEHQNPTTKEPSRPEMLPSVSSRSKLSIPPPKSLKREVQTVAQFPTVKQKQPEQHTKDSKKDKLSIFEDSDSDDDMFATNFNTRGKPSTTNFSSNHGNTTKLTKSIFDDDSDDGDLFAVVKKNTKIKNVTDLSSLTPKENTESVDKVLLNFPPPTPPSSVKLDTNNVENINAKKFPGFVKSVAAGLKINPLALKPGAKRPGSRPTSPQQIDEAKEVSSSIYGSTSGNVSMPQDGSADKQCATAQKCSNNSPILSPIPIQIACPEPRKPPAPDTVEEKPDSKELYKQMEEKTMEIERNHLEKTTVNKSAIDQTPIPKATKKTKSIFEDSDSDDELFGSKNKNTQLELSKKATTKAKSIFDDNNDEALFIPRQLKKPTMEATPSVCEEEKSEPNPEVVDTSVQSLVKLSGPKILQDANENNPLESLASLAPSIGSSQDSQKSISTTTRYTSSEQNVEEKLDLLNCLTKGRSKVLQRRRPPSKKVRTNPITQPSENNFTVPQEISPVTSTSKIESKITKPNLFGDSSSDSEDLFK